MSHCLFHNGNVRSDIQHSCRKRSAKVVGSEFLNSSGLCPFFNHLEDGHWRHFLLMANISVFSNADKKLGAALFSTYFKPLLKPNEHNLGCGDETLLIAFADNSDFLIEKNQCRKSSSWTVRCAEVRFLYPNLRLQRHGASWGRNYQNKQRSAWKFRFEKALCPSALLGTKTNSGRPRSFTGFFFIFNKYLRLPTG